LLDEIQAVDEWEKTVNSLRLLPGADIYITGSNAYLLASEISTLLSGRYVEIKMLPLSFAEYLDFHGIPANGDLEDHFNRYVRFGGFPGIVQLAEQPETIMPVLEGIYNTVIMKDVIQRNTVRDAALLESVVRFVAANVGSQVSTKKVSDYLTSAGRKVSSETIDTYLRMLENAYIIYRARRYDLKGKLHLKTLEKFYFVDTGLRNALLGLRDGDYGYILENIVYFELLRRGYEVSIGKLGPLEVDFVVTKPDEKIYIQVSASILGDAARERELAPLRGIRDNYEKIILTMDKTFISDFDGIRNIYLLDFLLDTA
jgi:predicted AAA+ superfamily ATPase